MNVLIIGGGGREHAIACGITKSSKLDRLYAAPGNAGTAQLGENLSVEPSDLDELLRIAQSHQVDLTIVGPEAPLCAGVVDRFRAEGMKIFGPTADAARLEGDKAFAKHLMRRALVPTADARAFDDYEAAKEYIATRDCALVVKASGLAAGKGVIVCDEPSEAILAAERMMVDGQFGDAGRTILVEERLTGPEVSVFALVDGAAIYVLDTAQDYKRIGDNDSGPNTGGMGAVSPAAGVDSTLLDKVERDILVPIVDALRAEGISYQGVLYAGLMLTAAGPKVLEFNCRFGDPEAQVLLPRIESDLLEVFDACCDGRLAEQNIRFDAGCAVTVVMASAGYPGKYQTDCPIVGIEQAESGGAQVFLAGAEATGEGLRTAGGRVLAVTGRGADRHQAREKAYLGVGCIKFEGAYYRRDIAG